MEENPFTAARVPGATYRLQFNGQFGFADAADIIPYLKALGITDLYVSPCFTAKKGSMHGYDIVDHNRLNPELGSEEDYERLTDELHGNGMGQVLDIVPNHMCIDSSDNAWWTDVLENGPSSLYADFFDIDWEPVKRELRNKILVPILGDQYGTVLENGELSLLFDSGSFYLCYYEHRLPIMPKSYSHVLIHRLEELEQEITTEDVGFQELLSIDTALRNLPPYTEKDPEKIVERYREKEVIKRRLCSLYNDNPVIREFIDRNTAIFNGVKGEPASFDLLDDLLRGQVYRLSHWRVATEEINYRRFFDINSLAAIRMENPAVFDETHRLIFRLVREGKITGLRVDHLDGLYDPSAYLERLQKECFLQRGLGLLELADGRKFAETEERERADELLRRYHGMLALEPGFRPFYIIGEKILMKGEKLPEEWPLFSTTGYEFANLANGLFVDTANGKAFENIYARFIRSPVNFTEIVYEKKKLVMQAAMSGEINTLGFHLNAISEVDRHTRDFTLNSLIKALVEVIAFFPVYRTYTNGREIAERDRHYIDYAIARAKRKNPATDPSVFDFIRGVLLLGLNGRSAATEREPEEWLDFVMRFQQITGPVTAKGIEDTTFYVYNRLVSLNEVGGSPERFGVTMEAFHGQNIERQRSRHIAMLAASTHDTKRSEDVRARINVVSEMPDRWRESLARWSRLNRKRKAVVDGQPVPDRNEEYLLYQTLIGAWPPEPAADGEWEEFRTRIREYMIKAVREAKVNSSWISPNPLYEDAVIYFVDTVLNKTPDNYFLADMREFQKTTAHCGMLNSLSQTLLRMTAPGIPDFYQGSELWDFSLVDPDNRRPVNFELRRKLLEEIRYEETAGGPLAAARTLAADMGSGKIKMYLIRRTLALRGELGGLFTGGKYIPLDSAGEFADHVCAFERSSGEKSVITVVPRFFTGLVRLPGNLPHGRIVWGDTRIAVPFEDSRRRFRSVFTGETIAASDRDGTAVFYLADLLADFPVALLESLGE